MNTATKATPPILRLSQNTAGRDFVVGDIHGHGASLDALLAHVDFDTGRDRLIAVGDLIDRGPDSAACLARVREPWCFSVRGNHEQMMIDACAKRGATNAEALWLINGGAWSRGLSEEELQASVALARALPIALEIEIAPDTIVGVVHADVAVSNWADFARRIDEPAVQEAALWSRRTLSYLRERSAASIRAMAPIDGVAAIYHGHTPLAEPVAVANRRWLDTGVFLRDGKLTLTELARDEPAWSVDAQGVIGQTAWMTR